MQTKIRDTSYRLGADILRVIAGFGVVSVHISTTFVNYPPIFQTPSWWAANLLDSAFRITVPLFVMLSGMLLLDLRKNYTAKQFFSKRFNKIFSPLIFWIAAYFLWRYLFWHQHFSPIQLVRHIYTQDVYYHLYFLNIIVGLYCITPLIRFFLKKSGRKQQIALTILCLIVPVLISAANYLLPSVAIGTNAFTIFLLYVGYYLAGHLLDTFHPKKIVFFLLTGTYFIATNATAILNLWQMRSTGWSQTLVNKPNFNRYFYDHFSLNVFIMSLTAFIILNTLPGLIPSFSARLTPFFKYISGYIFGIFLIHPMIMDLLDRYLLFLNISHMSSFLWLLMAAKILLVFAISLLVVNLVKRSFAGKYIFGE